jgi:hypothetical protein
MTEVIMADGATKPEAPAGGEPVETVETLKAKLAEMESTISSLDAEATKNKHLRRKAEKERDEARKTKPAGDGSDKDYKTLWEQSNEKLTKSLERAKQSDINTALTEQFGKTKVAQDRYAAALKLIDANLVEWDEDNGVDKSSVVAAVAKLKNEHKFLFESTVDPTDPKKPGDAGSKGTTITRTLFDNLTPHEKVEKMKAKVKIID